MALTAGIVGLPNVGKSTLFNAITQAGAEAANYPFATIDPIVGTVEVPDERLTKITELIKPKKTIPNYPRQHYSSFKTKLRYGYFSLAKQYWRFIHSVRSLGSNEYDSNRCFRQIKINFNYTSRN